MNSLTVSHIPRGDIRTRARDWTNEAWFLAILVIAALFRHGGLIVAPIVLVVLDVAWLLVSLAGWWRGDVRPELLGVSTKKRDAFTEADGELGWCLNTFPDLPDVRLSIACVRMSPTARMREYEILLFDEADSGWDAGEQLEGFFEAHKGKLGRLLGYTGEVAFSRMADGDAFWQADEVACPEWCCRRLAGIYRLTFRDALPRRQSLPHSSSCPSALSS